jgi:chromate reductase
VLAIAGSLRRAALNKALVRAAIQVAPSSVALEDFGNIDGVPLFNEEIEKALPEKVKLLKSKIVAADSLLIATPEYNISLPGVLENAIDWASRPGGDNNSFDDKPVAIMIAGGTMGARGRSSTSCAYASASTCTR